MLTPKDAWLATLGQLQLQLNRSTFDTWLKGSEVLAYEDGEFVIRVRHAYAKDWLDKHLKSQIIQTLSQILKRAVQVNFVVYLPNRQRADITNAGPLFASVPAVNDSQAAPEPLTDLTVDEWLSNYDEWDPRVSHVRYGSTHDDPPVSSIPLDRRFTFDTFVTGPSNHFAHAAARAVVEAPGTRFNPLVIYGGVGMGKTHLLQAIGHESQRTGRQVVYLTAEAFTNELVEAIRAQKTDDFRARFRSLDLLLMDDIQFMAGKTSTEEEFYHTFNAIISQGGQLVVVCNQHPRQLHKLDDRIRSRLAGGLLTDIQPPEFETRLEILQVKAAAQGSILPDDVASVLAHHATTNVRELEGLLNQVLARAVLTYEPLTMELARQVIDKKCSVPPSAAPSSSPKRSKLTDVLEATAAYHQLSLDDLLGKGRSKKVVHARQIAMYLAREETSASLPQIGEALGGRNHSTVLHGYQKIADSVADDDRLRKELIAIRQQLRLFPTD
jgi:chromosomal replication initiator protein